MAFIDEVREAARLQLVAGTDDWYYREYPYVLELSATGPAAAELGSNAYFTLPLGPEEYSIKRVMRQSVTPTMGGIIAEEAGLLWVEIRLSGTFGLRTKPARDTTGTPDPNVGDPFLAAGGLSGPGWTQRMLRNIFERYASLKASSVTGPFVQLIWHDMKTKDHWIVVPEHVDIPRTVARRHQFPYQIDMKGIAKAKNRKIVDSLSSLKGFGKIQKAIGEIGKAQAAIRAVVSQTVAYLDEVKFYVEGIENVMANVTLAVDSLELYSSLDVEEVPVGRSFFRTTAAELETTLIAMETQPEVPAAVRATFFEALDGLHHAAAQVAVFGRTYAQQMASIQSTEGGAASDTSTTLAASKSAGAPKSMTAAAQRRERVNDEDLVDAGSINTARLRGSYTGFVQYAIRELDSLPSIAAARLGDGSLWYDLALINGLRAPYVTSSRPPGTVGPGDIIVVPTVTAGPSTAVVAGEGDAVGESILGVDIALNEDSNSIPGRPVVDIAIDQRTKRDCKTVSGVPNLGQALQLRMWTPQGSMPMIPDYGVRRQVGVGAVGAFLTLLRLSVEQAIRQDSRVTGLGAVRFNVDNDLVEIDADVTPIGSISSQSVTISVV